MKIIHIISGILLFLLIAVSSASALTLTQTNIETGSMPSGASVSIDVTYSASDHTITFVDHSSGVTNPRITWVAYNLDVDMSSITGSPSASWQKVDWKEKNNFGAGGVFGDLLRAYAQGNPGANQFTTVVVTVPNFGGTIPGNSLGNQVGVHFVCNEFSCFVSSNKNGTSNIPEFPTVALPVAAILGLMFILQRRKEN